MDGAEKAMFDIVVEPELTNSQKFLGKLKSVPSNTFSILQGLVLFSGLLVVLYLVLITPHQVDGRSMDPTYTDKEYLVANKVIYKINKPSRGDVIIFKYSETRDFIKRVIAIPGDQVGLIGGKIYVNGVLLNESYYLDASIVTEGGYYLKDGMTITVQDNYVFVAGDNRPHSSDSRAFGPVEFSNIKGKVILVFYPFDSFRIIKKPIYNL